MAVIYKLLGSLIEKNKKILLIKEDVKLNINKNNIDLITNNIKKDNNYIYTIILKIINKEDNM
jgi:hypothetical protein